jgi:hypothetical protein
MTCAHLAHSTSIECKPKSSPDLGSTRSAAPLFSFVPRARDPFDGIVSFA